MIFVSLESEIKLLLKRLLLSASFVKFGTQGYAVGCGFIPGELGSLFLGFELISCCSSLR